MSEQQPNTSTATTSVLPYHHQQLPVHGASGSTGSLREYRKGNWTVEETLVLISAKKLNDERCTKSSSSVVAVTETSLVHSTSSRAAGGELKWKWVENYCWANGCYRSQNQCNDKWDNLLRDYKKVRDYELRSSSDLPSYWEIDRQQRKDQGLPTNLVPQIYQALNNVVHRRYQQQRPTTAQLQPTVPNKQVVGHLSPPPAPTEAPPPASVEAVPETSDSETESSAEVDGDHTKRRKVRGIGSSIIRGATIIARSIQTIEENRQKRHRELMELEERRIRAEETQNENHRQGMANIATAINNLSGAIETLSSDPSRHP